MSETFVSFFYPPFQVLTEDGSRHGTFTHPSPLIGAVLNLFMLSSPWLAMSQPFGRRVEGIILVNKKKLVLRVGIEPT